MVAFIKKNRKAIIGFAGALVLLFILLSPLIVKAAGEFDNLSYQQVRDAIYRLAGWLLGIIGTVLVIAIIYQGVRIMWSGSASDPNQYAKEKTRFKYLLIGAVVIFGVLAIIETVKLMVQPPGS
ncbi:MAG: hypothetical protein CEN90_734 [Parcubacteria group bacterium Licking1014_17]|nr:MAG: hypothetical protein CEN90_734 [Parcubacteria group bacterium Licking1014_17]